MKSSSKCSSHSPDFKKRMREAARGSFGQFWATMALFSTILNIQEQ
jgi:hypothetical protein